MLLSKRCYKNRENGPSEPIRMCFLGFIFHCYIGADIIAGNYGFSGMQEFQLMMEEAGLCQATADKVPNNAGKCMLISQYITGFHAVVKIHCYT